MLKTVLKSPSSSFFFSLELSKSSKRNKRIKSPMTPLTSEY